MALCYMRSLSSITKFVTQRLGTTAMLVLLTKYTSWQVLNPIMWIKWANHGRRRASDHCMRNERLNVFVHRYHLTQIVHTVHTGDKLFHDIILYESYTGLWTCFTCSAEFPGAEAGVKSKGEKNRKINDPQKVLPNWQAFFYPVTSWRCLNHAQRTTFPPWYIRTARSRPINHCKRKHMQENAISSE